MIHQKLARLVAAGALLGSLVLSAQADEKMSGKMDKMSGAKMFGKMDKMAGGKMSGKMMSCPACKMMSGKMSGTDKMEMDHMSSMMTPAEKKTMMGMSASEKALLMKAMKAGMMHGKTMGKM